MDNDTNKCDEYSSVTHEQALLGQIIAKYRQAANMKQNALAQQINIPPSTWSRIEKGESALSALQLIAFTRCLKISAEEIIKDYENVKKLLMEKGIDVLPTTSSENKLNGIGPAGVVVGSVLGGLLPILFPTIIPRITKLIENAAKEGADH